MVILYELTNNTYWCILYAKLQEEVILNSNESVDKEITAKSLNDGFSVDFLYAFRSEFSIIYMIELKPRTKQNAITYFERTQDNEIKNLLPSSVKSLQEAVDAFKKSILPDSTSFGMCIYDNGRYIGDIWCYCISKSNNPNAMLSFCIFDKIMWGKGVCSSSVGLFLKTTAKKFSLKNIGAFTFSDNVGSIGVLTNNGFIEVERFIDNGRESIYFEKTLDSGKD